MTVVSRFQPVALGAGATWAVIVGGVGSSLTCPVAEAVRPTVSVMDRVTAVSPGVVTVTGDGHAATSGADPGVQVKVTVPEAALAQSGGFTVALIVGRLLSRLTVAT